MVLLPLLLILLLPLLSLSYYHFCYSIAFILLLLLLFLFLVSGPIRPEGSPFGRFLTLGCWELKEYVSTQTYLYNPSMQPSLECLVINWMVNSGYRPHQIQLYYFTGMFLE